MKQPKTRRDAWAEAQRRFHRSDVHLQMARELGLNPKKCGGSPPIGRSPGSFPPRVHCGVLPQTMPPGETGAGGPPRRGREAAAAIGPRQGQTPTSMHRRMTEHDVREVTTERRPGMDHLGFVNLLTILRAGCKFSRVQTLLTLAIAEAKSGSQG